MTHKTYQNWQVDVDESNIHWLTLNVEGKSANTIDSTVLEELSEILEKSAHDDFAKGLVIQSGKDKGFIAGANIDTFSNFEDKKAIAAFLKLGHKVFDELAACSLPTVALVDGFCLGGGLELSLACRYIIASDSPSSKLALPEVKLGIQPGWGGSVRLPRKIGSMAAFDVMLTGRMLAAKKAKRLGLVDAVVPKRQLKRAATYFINKLPAQKKPPLYDQLFKFGPARKLLAKMLTKQVAKKARKSHYPAPYAMIDTWVSHSPYQDSAYQAELDSIERLTKTDTAANLVRVFGLQEALKKEVPELEKPIKHVHVVGAGTMGGDIAAWCAYKGFRVTLQDQNAAALSKAIARAHKLYKKKIRAPHLRQLTIDRLIPDVAGRGIKGADVIIEAIFENLEAKQELFKRLDAEGKPDVLLATNTSSIPLNEIASVLDNPKRLVGVHFFNPVAMMPLVEVIADTNSEQKDLDKAMAFVKKIDKLPLPVKSSPGFLVNRVLMPYLLEAVTMVEEGIKKEAIDEVALDFGMPMGPIELADTVGIDICLHVANILSEHLGVEVPKHLHKMVEDGRCGKKTGHGFYRYQKGKPVKSEAGTIANKNTISDRLFYRMYLEAMKCLSEQVIQDNNALDVGMIFGTGFAPFKGGLTHYFDTIGEAEIEEKLSYLAEKYGERFSHHVQTKSKKSA